MSEPLHNWAPDRQAWLQGIFDTGTRGLLKQGQQSIAEGTCQYRDPIGNKCALGMCIPDSKYKPTWDGVAGVTPYVTPDIDSIPSIAKRSKAVAKALGCVTEEEAEALRRFQACHDDARNSDFVPSFTGQAKAFAMKFNLNTDVFQEGTAS